MEKDKKKFMTSVTTSALVVIAQIPNRLKLDQPSKCSQGVMVVLPPIHLRIMDMYNCKTAG